MDKRKAVKWLEGFICSQDVMDTDECVCIMAPALNIKPEEAHEVLAECEEKLIEMFLEWYNEVSPEGEE